MPSKWPFPRKSVAGPRRASLAAFILATFAGSLPLCGNVNGAEVERPPKEASPKAKAPLEPRNTDFNSRGFNIRKVVRMEQSLNALGITAQFGKTNKVGKYVELPKRLEPSERGEHFIITLKYSRKGPPARSALKYERKPGEPSASKPGIMPPPARVTLIFHYKFSNEEHVETLTREYSDLKPGRYRLRIENTGERYWRRGRIEYWRVSIFADGELAARKESFLWPIFQGEKEVQSREGA